MSRILLVVLVTTSSLSCAAPTARDTTADAASTAMSLPGMPATGEPTFPRTATYYLDQDRLPPMEELARYDLVVLDHEWAHRVPESYFDGLRSRNPRVRLLAYMNLVDLPGALGSPGYWPIGTPCGSSTARTAAPSRRNGSPPRHRESRSANGPGRR